MTSTQVTVFSERLDTAATSRTATPQFGEASGMDVPMAYAVQEALVARRLARSERLVGLKLGLTSRAKMAQMGVEEVIWGRLTDAMRIPDGGTVQLAEHIHPKAEPEVAFLIANGSISAVAPAIELIDSRYVDFRFTLPEVIADNTSASGFVVGPWSPVPPDVDNLGVLLEIDGRVVQVGSTAAILGDPRRALAETTRLAGRHGIDLPDEWILLAGAATAAVPVRPGAYVRAVVEKLGTASLTAVAGAVADGGVGVAGEPTRSGRSGLIPSRAGSPATGPSAAGRSGAASSRAGSPATGSASQVGVGDE